MTIKNKSKKVFIIAGEVSGDVLGAEIMRAAPSGIKFAGIGGESMKAAGLKTLFPISDLAVMGFVEVLAKSRTLLCRINQAAEAILREQPDVVLTIDSPSFASRVIKKVRRKSKKIPKFYHVVAPMVWAWGAWRAKKYARIFDKLFCFFDFEKPYFEKHGLGTIAIGHPIYGVARRHFSPKARRDENLIALLPGSRMSEAAKIMRIFESVADSMPGRKFAIPITETTGDFIASQIRSWKNPPSLVPFKDRYGLYNRAGLAVATSGTATAELAMMRVPSVVVYRSNFLTRAAVRLVIKIKYASMVNILAGREIYPELLGRSVNAENILFALKNIDAAKMRRELAAADHFWHKKQSPVKIVADHLASA